MCSFLKKELTLASNIKDKQNRKCVSRILTLLIERLRLTQHENGLICFVGVDATNGEIVEIIHPQIPVASFIYKCASKFDESVIDELEKKTRETKHVALITGDETKIYSFAGTWNLVKTINGCLIKRHKKGGQSSVRFERLADESRFVYAERIVFVLNQLNECWVFGSKEMKNIVLTHKDLTKPLKTCDQFESFSENFINSNKKELERIITRVEINERKVQQVLDLIETNPDFLVFGNLDSVNCETIVTIDEELEGNEKAIVVSRDSKFFAKLKPFGSIGKLYFAPQNTIDE